MESGCDTTPLVQCPVVDCGNPQLPENSSLIGSTGTLKGQEVTFQCNIGPDPQVITVVCTSVSGGSEGVWSPDLELVVCGGELEISRLQFNLYCYFVTMLCISLQLGSTLAN